MYIVIVGGGRVGYYLAKALIEEGHEVLIVEQEFLKTGACHAYELEFGLARGAGCLACLGDVLPS